MKLDFSGQKVGGFMYEIQRVMGYESTLASQNGEVIAAARRIKDNDKQSWQDEWVKTAENTNHKAKTYLADGEIYSAYSAFLRASNYYRTAGFYNFYEDPRFRRRWEQSNEMFRNAIELSRYLYPDTYARFAEIPFESAKLPGYFIPSGKESSPTLIVIGGFDSTLEELYYWIGAEAKNFGWNCLCVEGPGQVGALMRNPGLTFRPNYEVPMKSIVDYVVSLPEVDERIAVCGMSLGGYLAPRGAAFDKRIKAVIANSPVVDFAAGINTLVPEKIRNSKLLMSISARILSMLSFEARWFLNHAEWNIGGRSAYDILNKVNEYTLLGLEDKFEYPFLAIIGEHELTQATPDLLLKTVQFLAHLNCDVNVAHFTSDEGLAVHCQHMDMISARDVIFSWLNQEFKKGIPTPSGQNTQKHYPTAFFQSIKKHFGQDILKG